MAIDLSALVGNIRPEATVLLFGAGASAASNAPTGKQLTTYLADTFGLEAEGFTLDEIATLAEEGTSRREVVTALRTKFRGLRPTGGLLNLPLYDWKALYTTNYDVERFLAGDWEGLRATFDSRMTEAAPVELLQATLANGRVTYGDLIAVGTPVNSVLADYTVVDVPMAFEKGELTGRVSFNADDQVAGLFFLPVDQPASKNPSDKEES